MTKAEYAEKLKLPQWQQRRLKILERDGFTCTICNEYGHQVHAHHLYYENGKMPWEHPDSALICVCDKCHDYEHEIEKDIKKDLFDSFKKAGFTNASLIHIILGLKCVTSLPGSPGLVAHCIGTMFSSKEQFKNTYENFKE